MKKRQRRWLNPRQSCRFMYSMALWRIHSDVESGNELFYYISDQKSCSLLTRRTESLETVRMRLRLVTRLGNNIEGGGHGQL